jgi:hypothetical protein
MATTTPVPPAPRIRTAPVLIPATPTIGDTMKRALGFLQPWEVGVLVIAILAVWIAR